MRWSVGETPQTEMETRPGPGPKLYLQVLAAHVDPLIFTSLYLDPRFFEGVLAEGTGLAAGSCCGSGSTPAFPVNR